MAVGLCGYESLKAHHTPHGIVQSNSYMDPPKSYLSHSFKRQGDLVENTLKVFHIETVLNNRAFDGPLSFLTKNEDDFTETDRLKYQAMKWTLDKLPFAARREIFMRTPAAYELIGCYAGACDPEDSVSRYGLAAEWVSAKPVALPRRRQAVSPHVRRAGKVGWIGECVARFLGGA